MLRIIAVSHLLCFLHYFIASCVLCLRMHDAPLCPPADMALQRRRAVPGADELLAFS